METKLIKPRLLEVPGLSRISANSFFIDRNQQQYHLRIVQEKSIIIY